MQSRRHFLQFAALSGGGMLVNLGFVNTSSAATDLPSAKKVDEFAPNPFIQIRTDGSVLLVAQNPELGQGVKTALPMILADELGADFATVHIQYGHLNAALGPQEAGGSMSVFDCYQPLREAGAMARTMLIRVAAKKWGVAEAECDAKNSRVEHRPTGRHIGFGSLASEAAQEPAPRIQDIALRSKAESNLIGKRVASVDNQAIVTGQHRYAIDRSVPGMLHAVYVKSPVFGAKAISANLAQVRKQAGIIDAFIVEGTSDYYGLLPGIAIIGNSTWATFKAQKMLDVLWSPSPARKQTSVGYARRAVQIGKQRGVVAHSAGDAAKVLQTAPQVISADYHYPFLHHAPLEPMNALAIPLPGGGMQVIAPTQLPDNARELAAKVLKISKEKVELQFTRSGGAFGRRLTNDFVAEVVAIAQRIGKPVKLTWTRESDTQHGQYRPAGWHFLSAALDASGDIQAWTNHFVTVGLNSTSRPSTAADMGGKEFPARFVPNYALEKSVVSTNVPTSWYRAPGSNGIAFVVQSFLDELAHAAKKDPLALRLSLLGPDRIFPGTGRWDPAFDTSRMKAVLRMAADKAGWGRKMPQGSGQGIAFHFSHQGYVAEVAEVSVTPEGVLRVERVVAAVDVGRIINLSGAEAQVQGSIIDGLSGAWLQELTIDSGRVSQSNFHDYPLLRIDAAPRQIDIHFIESEGSPTGLGEPALPPVVPAVCNAIFAVTGKRIRSLPISKNDLHYKPNSTNTMRTPTLRGADIGAPLLAGQATQTDSSVEVVSGGADIWNTRDECHFASLAVDGDFEFSAQVNAIGMADLYSKAGIMWRASMDAEAAHVMLLAFGNNDPRNKNNGGIEFQSRLSKGVECSAIYPPQPLPSQPDFPVQFPKVWLKLVRKGDTFTSFFSQDGTQWKPYCEHRQVVPASGFLGLAATSHNEKQTITSRFSNLRIA
jgi:isoquinoline 1-oxidoreductase beta subunit